MSLSSFFRSRRTAPGIRGFINRYPIPVGIGIILIAAIFLYEALRKPSLNDKAYYSTDDGATLFAMTARVPPFYLDGKEAVGAIVYSCDGGNTRFAGYLYRYTPEGRPKAEAVLKSHRASGPPIGMEVKRPGTGKWLPLANKHTGPADAADDSSAITNVTCPDGNGSPSIFNP